VVGTVLVVPVESVAHQGGVEVDEHRAALLGLGGDGVGEATDEDQGQIADAVARSVEVGDCDQGGPGRDRRVLRGRQHPVHAVLEVLDGPLREVLEARVGERRQGHADPVFEAQADRDQGGPELAGRDLDRDRSNAQGRVAVAAAIEPHHLGPGQPAGPIVAGPLRVQGVVVVLEQSRVAWGPGGVARGVVSHQHHPLRGAEGGHDRGVEVRA